MCHELGHQSAAALAHGALPENEFRGIVQRAVDKYCDGDPVCLDGEHEAVADDVCRYILKQIDETSTMGYACDAQRLETVIPQDAMPRECHVGPSSTSCPAGCAYTTHYEHGLHTHSFPSVG